jgi:type III secretory pathway lipoprotein EscJ
MKCFKIIIYDEQTKKGEIYNIQESNIKKIKNLIINSQENLTLDNIKVGGKNRVLFF